MSEPTIAPGFADSAPRRLISLLLAVAAGLALTLRPDILADAAPIPVRIALALLLVGLAGSLGHALGLRPGRRHLSWLIDPRVAWPLLLLGLLCLLVLPL